MAYGLRYKITWKNRQVSNDLADVYYVNILEKDYVGSSLSLEGADKPFLLKYQSGDDRLPFILRPSECEVNYWNNGAHPLSIFYSEDDEKYRIDFYCLSIENTVLDKLLWSGYMVQDDCQEDFKFPPYVVTLKATDNLGLLKDIAFNDAYFQFPNLRSLYSQFNANVSITFLNNISIDVPIIIATLDINPGDILNYNGIDYTITAASFDGDFLQLSVAQSFPGNGTFADQQITIYKVPSLIGKISLFDIVSICLYKTGIALPFNIYTNIYENSTSDRGGVATATFFEQTFIFSGMFQNDDGTWFNCYDILEKILFTFNATLFQAEGTWNIIRFPEAQLFTDNAIAGTQYLSDFTTPTTTTLDPNVEIDKDGDAEISPINANQIRRIVRPFKDVKLTFDYHQPASLIKNNDLQDHGVLLATSTVTIDGIDYRYDDYDIPSYWEHYQLDDSFIRVVTQLATTDFQQDVEKERYVVTPGHTDEQRGVQFNPIEVSKGDELDLSLQFKTDTDSGDFIRFWISFMLVGTDGNFYYIRGLATSVGSSPVFWSPPLGSPIIDLGVYFEFPDDTDTSQYIPWTLSAFDLLNGNKLIIPQDGMLVIIVHGTNGNTGSPRQTTLWNELQLTILNKINDSTSIIGHYHQQSQGNDIKNNFDEKLDVDDSPRNTIAGTLFTSQITNFGTDIGDIYFTKTKQWHRANIEESKRLGEIITYERKLLSYKARTVLEGTFWGLRYTKDSAFRFMSLLNIMQVSVLTDTHFVFGLVTFDYMNATFDATIWELYQNGDEGEFTYLFKYIFRTS